MMQYQVTLNNVAIINRLTIKRREGFPVTHEHLPRYVVYSPDGRALEEFRRKASAQRWCEATTDFVQEESPTP